LGGIIMSEVVVDSKGRIVIPEDVRKKLGLRSGSRVKVRVEQGAVVITKGVEAKEFIKEMEGFLKEGSPVQATDPLRLKEIWLKS